jgi:hypothetical protein
MGTGHTDRCRLSLRNDTFGPASVHEDSRTIFGDVFVEQDAHPDAPQIVGRVSPCGRETGDSEDPRHYAQSGRTHRGSPCAKPPGDAVHRTATSRQAKHNRFAVNCEALGLDPLRSGRNRRQ